MKILTRYILKEMLAPTLLGFTFYTSIILMRQLFDFAEMIIKRSLPISTVGELLYLSLPHIVVLTVPMSLLFGILIAVGRMSSDSEIIAMRALGISTKTIYLPVFLFSFAVFLLNLYLMNVVLPKGNTRLTALKAELFTSSIEKIIKPRVFYEEYENLMIYVNDVDPRTGVWKGVFVADSRNDEPSDATTPHAVVENGGQDRSATMGLQGGGGQRVVIGENGTLSLMPNKQVWMNLRGAETHVWSPRKPERYDLNRNALQRILLPDKFSGETTGHFARSFREMNLTELLAQRRLLRQTNDRVSRNAVEVEIHKKFAIPFACIVFGVLGLPLGITNRRGGKSSGFSLSIAIIVVYYILSNNGEHAATNGKLSPFLGMWGPNIILVGIGIWMLLRANRDAGSERSGSGFFSKISAAVLARRSARQSAVSRRDDDEEPSLLNRLDITFPNIVDRYILREFLKVLGLVLVSVIALSLIIDYTGISGDIRENHIAFHTVFAYYRFMLFTILDWTLPISVLVATLVTFGMLSKNNEITAIKSSGVSLYRIALPILAVSVFVSIFAYLNLDFVLPYSNQRVDYLRRKIKGQVTYASSDQQRVWFRGKGRYLINFLSYDRNAKALSQVQIFEFHPTDFHLTRRVYAQKAAWDGSGWVFENGWMRSFPEGGGSTYSPIVSPLRLYYSETPNDFATEVKAPNQMTFAQLRRYIANIRQSGYAPEQLTVELYKKTSWPAISIVMALIALPFAFKSGKKGALYGVAIALILGILYWMIFVIFTKFGEVGNLPAILSAWSANILFAIAAMYLFLHVET